MASIQPFKALRPQPQLASQVASRPYDVLNSKEAREEAAGNVHSFLHITKSEIDLPENTDIHTQAVYDKAKENLAAFIQRGFLFREEKPCYYIYQLVMNGRSQTGLVAASSVDDYEKDIIRNTNSPVLKKNRTVSTTSRLPAHKPATFSSHTGT